MRNVKQATKRSDGPGPGFGYDHSPSPGKTPFAPREYNSVNTGDPDYEILANPTGPQAVNSRPSRSILESGEMGTGPDLAKRGD